MKKKTSKPELTEAKAKVNVEAEVSAQTLTKEEALILLADGKKLTHKYFTDDEWMKLSPDGMYEFEDGNKAQPWFFWAHRQTEDWQTGWSIFAH